MTDSTAQHVAIIGMACRLPGARDILEFWQNLRDGVESITFFSNKQLAASGLPKKLLDDPSYVKASGVLDDIEMFDAGFFGFPPREAEATDPQQRLFLECAWKAFENAGYNAELYDGAVGVYAGAGLSTYLLRNLLSQRELIESLGDLNLLICNNKDFVPTRVSYKLNLKGPSINVSTACSTSLVAVHVACQSLLDYQCDMALAGGVGIQVPQVAGYRYQIGGVLAPDGRCRAFDAEARGTVSGNGVGAVVLKRVEDALADGDCIRAIILGSAINNDGSQKVGFTAPSIDGQAAVIAEAMSVAGVNPASIGYIEAHGTGTPLGDPIEIAALQRVFRAKTQAKRICAVGSVKTNIGHVDEAAGVAGLIKTVLALENQMIPPSLHYRRPNPQIDFENSPFFVNDQLAPWRAEGKPRRAGVSSFGIGGTNAHVIVEQAPETPASGDSRPWQLLCLSARTSSSLQTATTNLANALRQFPDLHPADVAYTLHLGRKEFEHRRVLLCRGSGEAAKVLESLDLASVRTGRTPEKKRPVVFLFPGQGAQYVNMGLDLYRHEEDFRGPFDQCAELLLPDLKRDVRGLLYGSARASADAEQLKQTAIAQPVLFAFEYALAKLLMAWGVEPQTMIGHSLGEYVAACLSGVLSLEDALMLVAARGKLMQELPKGAMLAVPMPADDLAKLLPPQIDMALLNAPELCVVSGRNEHILAFRESLYERGIACQTLQTSHAFHSAMMEPALEPFKQCVARTERKTPQIPYLSNVSGSWITAEQAVSAEYWCRHLRETVRFADGVQELLKSPDNILLEVGPGNTLNTLVKQQPASRSNCLVLSTTRHPKDQQCDVAVLLRSIGDLWIAGVPIRWKQLYAGQNRRRVPLPTYPFERRRYWIEPEMPRSETLGDEPGDPQRRQRVEDWFYVPNWKLSRHQPRKENTAQVCWLVLLDEGGWGHIVTRRLRDYGNQVLTARAGSEFRLDNGHFTLNPKRFADYTALVDHLCSLDKFPQRILHLWNVTPPRCRPLDPDEVDLSQYFGFYSLLFLAKALGANEITNAMRIEVVSSNMHNVTGTETLCPEKATILGPVQVIPKEYPNVQCRSIDIALPPFASQPDPAVVEQLIDLLRDEPSKPIVALRGSGVWECGLRADPLEAPTGPPACLRQRGTYLITGGLGSMGLAFAKYLASQVRANLVLVGRSGLPAEENWDAFLQDYKSACPPDLRCHHNEAVPQIDLPSRVEELARVEALVADELQIADLRAYEGLEASLHRLCSSQVCEYLADRGVDVSAKSAYSHEELRRQLGIRPQFGRFLSSLIQWLAEDGIVGIREGTIEFLASERPGSSTTLAHNFVSDYPDFKGIVELLQHCTGKYSSALSGEIPSISVLYPDGTTDFMDQCAANIREYVRDRIYLKVLAEFLGRVLAESAGRKVRILEVGGGSGGLTRQVLGLLKGHDVEYVFTDLGRSFVRQAEADAAAAGIEFMEFGLLDIGRDPEQQGYAPHSFDIVLGYNVVHATRQIRESIQNLRRLLVPGGLLCLVEATRIRRWDEMIWGLTEGWWLFEDVDLRARSPLINLDQWEEVLRGEEFEHVFSFPRDARARHETDAGLLIAQQSAFSAKSAATPCERPSGWDPRMASTIKKLREIQQLGSEVLVMSADVADREQMRRVITRTRERFSELHGVIHAAGILGQGLIHHKTEEEAAAVLSAKVRGTAVLATLLAEHHIELDFFALCSALSAIAPIVGQIDYSAANAFLDAFAACAGRRTRTVSINWGFWQELGMIEQARIPETSKRAIQDEIQREGWEQAGTKAFSCILAHCATTQVVVSPENLIRDYDTSPAEEGQPQHDGRAVRPASHPLEGASCEHPLFARRIKEGPGIESCISFLSPKEHWVLDEHRPVGKAVLPGTAYLELAFAAAAPHAGRRTVELRDVYFLSPLVVADDQRTEVRTVLTRQVEDDGFEFVVISRLETNRDAWQTHARGEIAFLEQQAPSEHDPSALAAACGEQTLLFPTKDGDRLPTNFELQVQRLTTRWKTFREVHFGPRQGLARLCLAEEYLGDLPSFQLHSALLDMATGFLYMRDHVDEGLPFSYRRVRILGPLPAEVTSHVRYAEHQRSGTISFDVKIMDGRGREVLDIEGYTFKSVAPAEQSYQQISGTAPTNASRFENFSLEIRSPGQLGTLQFVAAARRQPGLGEVEIEIRAAGLNFIEVLYALGMLPDPDQTVRFGLECAGRISRVGEGVEQFAVGDDVVAYAASSFALYTTTPVTAVRRMPAHLSYEASATIPAAYLTAYVALVNRGRLQAGERILIHAAAGGVGLAAVKIAQSLGAEVFATAGSDEKREFLRSLGIVHVMNSRTLDFAQEVMQRTAGEGVDVVLNSLGGGFINAGLAVLRRYGRFLELGKRDIFQNHPIGLRPFENSLSFLAIDVGTDLPDFSTVWSSVMERFERGELTPLPHRVFPVTQVGYAFEYMAQAKHIGKLVLSIRDSQALHELVRAKPDVGVPLHTLLGVPARHPSKASVSNPLRGAAPNPSRKVDNRTLHPRPDLQTAYRAPETQTEKVIADTWRDLLGISAVGADDNFFELDGDSLLAAQLMSRLYNALQVKLPLSLIFELPTVSGLANRLEAARKSSSEFQTVPTAAASEDEEEGEL